MSPAAKAYLISGYPRSMRDVVEYTEKVIFTPFNTLSTFKVNKFFYNQIQVLNGVILISWRQAVLQKQIDYGAKLGHGAHINNLKNFFDNFLLLYSCPLTCSNGT